MQNFADEFYCVDFINENSISTNNNINLKNNNIDLIVIDKKNI